MALPELFCWTRFGIEAGESIKSIFARKERERAENNGIFLWGIGNALGPSVDEFVRIVRQPEVLFSPIKSPARHKDVTPEMVVAWTSGIALDGELFQIPEHSLVTSGYDPSVPKGTHYALVCYSSEPLTEWRCSDSDRVIVGALRNLRSGRPVGSSQVTAVVCMGEHFAAGSPGYEVVTRVQLAYPYFVRLGRPVVLPNWENAEIRDQAYVNDALRYVRSGEAELAPHQLMLAAIAPNVTRMASARKRSSPP